MKSSIAIAFIFLLSAQCIFKVGIITYFQANRDYIAEVLCINKQKEITTCYGQCFLDKQLAIADESPKQSPVNKLQFESSNFIASSFEINLTVDSFQLVSIGAPQPLYAYYSSHTLFHPPC